MRQTVFMAALAMLMAGCAVRPLPASSVPAATPATSAWQTFRADSGYEIRYPLDSYSMRSGNAFSSDVVFPGLKVLEPNDAFVYAEPRSATYKISIAVRPNADNRTLDDAQALLAQNSVLPYGVEQLQNKTVQTATFGGAPAVRVDDLPVGPAGVTSQFVVIQNGFVYEVLVEPYQIQHNQAVPFDAGQPSAANRELVDEILATFRIDTFAAPTQPTHAPSTGSQTSETAVAYVLAVLRGWIGDAADSATVTAEHRDWPDSCFGAGYPYESCLAAITPGWEITFDAAGKRYVFRTNESGEIYRVTDQPTFAVGEVIASWTSSSAGSYGACFTADIGADAVAFGDCGGPLITGSFENKVNRDLLNQHVERFATFRAETPDGLLVFTGKGSEQASPADQRAIAELAKLMAEEARAGRPTAAAPNVIAYTRTGVLPACALVEATGRVVITNCEPNATPTVERLTSPALEQLFGWLDKFAPFEYAEAGQSSIKLTFAGRGSAAVTKADTQAVRTFVEGLLATSRSGQTDGRMRYLLPLVLPEGLDWNPAESKGDDRSYRALATDPSSQFRWVEMLGSLDALPEAVGEPTPVKLGDRDAQAYNLLEGYSVRWSQDGTNYALSSPFSLTETVQIASAMHPLEYEEFQQLLRERAQ